MIHDSFEFIQYVDFSFLCIGLTLIYQYLVLFIQLNFQQILLFSHLDECSIFFIFYDRLNQLFANYIIQSKYK
jgi:hypothetical protein